MTQRESKSIAPTRVADHDVCRRCGLELPEAVDGLRSCPACGFTVTQPRGARWQHFCIHCGRYVDIDHGCGCRAWEAPPLPSVLD